MTNRYYVSIRHDTPKVPFTVVDRAISRTVGNFSTREQAEDFAARLNA